MTSTRRWLGPKALVPLLLYEINQMIRERDFEDSEYYRALKWIKARLERKLGKKQERKLGK